MQFPPVYFLYHIKCIKNESHKNVALIFLFCSILIRKPNHTDSRQTAILFHKLAQRNIRNLHLAVAA